jgi:hypothetical protein
MWQRICHALSHMPMGWSACRCRGFSESHATIVAQLVVRDARRKRGDYAIATSITAVAAVKTSTGIAQTRQAYSSCCT